MIPKLTKMTTSPGGVLREFLQLTCSNDEETKPGKKYSPMNSDNFRLQTSVYIDDSVDWEPGTIFND